MNPFQTYIHNTSVDSSPQRGGLHLYIYIYIEFKIIKIYNISKAVCNDLICQIGILCPTTWNDIFHSNLSSRISTSNSKHYSWTSSTQNILTFSHNLMIV